MTGLLLAASLAALALPGPPAQEPVPPQTRPAVVGVVRGLDGMRGGPLPFAMVEVVDPPGIRAVLADSTGHYAIQDLGPGLWRLRASHVGYESALVEVLVPSRGSVSVDLALRARPVKLPPLRVGTEPLRIPLPDDRVLADAERARALVELRALELSPGITEAGVGAPGEDDGGEPPDPRTVLYMRGSTADLKLVLLDGAPVYTPFHLGGLLPSFDPEVLGTATHHVGGAPARYDGGLSYILDLRTRPARRDGLHGSGVADLMSLQGSAETSLGSDVGLLAAGRTLHDAASALAGGDGSPYGYTDGLVRADLTAGRTGHVYVTAFANRESVHLDLPGRGQVPGLDQARWGNDVLAGTFQGQVGSFRLDVGSSMSRYDAELPVQAPVAPGDAETPPDPDALPIVASGRTERARITVDAARAVASGNVRLGASFDGMRVRYGSRALEALAYLEPEVTASGSVVGGYVDVLQPLARELDLRWGLRADRFDPGGLRTALRVAVLWSLSEDALLTVAAGRYHQLARRADTEAQLDLGDAPELGARPGTGAGAVSPLGVAQSDHLVLSLDQILSPTVRLALEGFFKSFQGVEGLDDGELSSSGIDLRVLRQGEDITAWLGYSLAWYWETSAAGARSDFTGRHLLSAGARGRLAGPVGLDARVAFSDGLPLTAVNLESTRAFEAGEGPSLDNETGAAGTTAGRRLEDGFLRIDAEVFAEWDAPWGGRDMRLRPYLKVLNALDRRDALFYYFEPWRDEGITPLAELSLVPVLGLEWRF